MNPFIISLIPTFVVLAVAIISKRLHFALFTGLCTAAFIASGGALAQTYTLLSKRIFDQISDTDTLCTYSFLFILGIVITNIEFTGGAAAVARMLTKRLSSPRSAEYTSFFLSCSLFIDDYLNVLTAGYIMRPIMDRFGVAREKLAWLVHSLSSPIVIIAPLSTWLALITTQLEQAGIGSGAQAKIAEDPYFLFLKSIPFTFYSFLTLFALFFIITLRISYGPMKRCEQAAQQNRHEAEQTSENEPNQNRSSIHLFAPILTLIASFLVGIAYDGNHWIFGGTSSFIQALKETHHIAIILLLASILAWIVSMGLGLFTRALNWADIAVVTWTGIKITAPGVFTVFLASVLGALTRFDLQTGTHMAAALSGILHLWLLPLAIFIGATLTALVTGSAWGTIALLVPIAVQMVTSIHPILGAQAGLLTSVSFPLLLPILGAIFSGAACGNHLSPFADLSILTATSTGCSLIDHIRTQLWYAIPVVIATMIGFLSIGILVASYGFGLAIATAISYGIAMVVIAAMTGLCNYLF